MFWLKCNFYKGVGKPLEGHLCLPRAICPSPLSVQRKHFHSKLSHQVCVCLATEFSLKSKFQGKLGGSGLEVEEFRRKQKECLCLAHSPSPSRGGAAVPRYAKAAVFSPYCEAHQFWGFYAETMLCSVDAHQKGSKNHHCRTHQLHFYMKPKNQPNNSLTTRLLQHTRFFF